MTEHLTLDAPKSLSGEINPLQSPDSELRPKASVNLGALSLLHWLDKTGSSEPLNVFDDTVITGGTESMTNNQEGAQNAELFKSRYDAAVESIDNALQGGSDELSSKISTILSSIDALGATPYISSAPEFVAMVQDARSTIEAVNSFITLNGEDRDPIIDDALSLSKQQLSGTLIAYSPRR
ncbi:MAG: hypothetical protein V4611_02220 [Patescibacteria group bacterium]